MRMGSDPSSETSETIQMYNDPDVLRRLINDRQVKILLQAAPKQCRQEEYSF